MSVALGKLPWGFASSPGGPITLRAWEAVVLGDKTYCVFVLGAPTNATWEGVSGFIKAVFRWNAPTSQSMDIAGIDASAPYDSTLRKSTVTYGGMMDAAAKLRGGSISETNFVAGELAFVTATTNNQPVNVDFASWVKDVNGTGLVLGNVQSTNKPNYAESVYATLDNGDGTVAVVITSAIFPSWHPPSGITDSYQSLDSAWSSYKGGNRAKPVARRCGGALYLNYWKGEPVPAGKCDAGLAWSSSNTISGFERWSSLPNTTAPMNGYMVLDGSSYAFARRVGSGLRVVLSETYIHMWDRNYD